MDYTQFVTMFKSIFLQGFARPRQGVRRIVAELVKRYRACGGEFRMKCGVKSIKTNDRRASLRQILRLPRRSRASMSSILLLVYSI